MTENRWAELDRAAPDEAVARGGTIRRGSRVVLRPRASADVVARALDGRRATVERIDADLDDNVIVSVVLEDDAARALGKGRQLGHRFFFAPDELEATGAGDAAPARILIAGIGNVFLGDDGFGVHVARRLADETLPDGVDAVEFGIRGMDLAYALGDGYAAAIMVDLAPRGEAPGTLSVVDPEVEELRSVAIEGHGMDPVRVLALAKQLGGMPARTLVVGCEPGVVPDPQSEDVVDELSPNVADAVDRAVALVRSLLDDLVSVPGR